MGDLQFETPQASYRCVETANLAKGFPAFHVFARDWRGEALLGCVARDTNAGFSGHIDPGCRFERRDLPLVQACNRLADLL
jgi:hypothetical protein